MYRTISELNKSLLDSYLKDKKINYAHIVAHNMDHQLGIIGVYSDEYKKGDSYRFQKLDENLEVIDISLADTPYYGLSPVIDNEKILSAISKLEFATSEDLEDFIKRNSSYFMLHAYQADYLPAFARYLIISFAYNFSVSFKLDQSMKALLEKGKLIKIVGDNIEVVKKHTVVVSEDNAYISIRGCPIKEILEVFQDLKFKKYCDDIWQIADDGSETIKTIYRKSSNIKCADVEVFYSGTLIRPIKFKVESNCFENSNTETIILNFEKTSYATVFALDNDFSDHPLLGNYKSKINKLFEKDDNLIKKLKVDLKECDENKSGTNQRIDCINNYLKECFNVNQICVSANITTSDDYLMMAVRGNKVMDSGCLYPSVNGNAEIADTNVSFYQKRAIMVDYPTIELTGQNENIRFNSEIQREASAELQLESDAKSFRTCALIIMGICPDEPRHDYKRRLHFNILYDYKSNKCLAELMKQGENANESFENKSFIGIRINVFNGIFERLKLRTKKIPYIILENKDLLESMLLLVVVISQLLSKDYLQWNAQSIINLLLALLVIFADIYKLKKWICRKRYIKHNIKCLYINTKSNYKDIDQNIQEFYLNEYYPIGIASLLYKIEQKIGESNRRY